MSAQPGFITFEGVEGSGKSTQLYLLSRAFQAAGAPVQVTREPGGTPLAEKLRALVLADTDGGVDPRCELFLYLAARHDHVTRLVRPALAAGRWVLCDRFADATVAYQGFGRELDPEAVARLAWWGHGLRPELTLLLDLPVADGLARVAARGEANRLDREAEAFHLRVRDGYRQIAKAEPDRVVPIDATDDVATVHARIVDAVRARFGNRLPEGLAPSAEARP
ncbi:MAG: dTMP kinase [Nitrospirae bacterium]|nr:dTMP kinase [Nitrospirota bacterium]